jgi:hypothetical protein
MVAMREVQVRIGLRWKVLHEAESASRQAGDKLESAVNNPRLDILEWCGAGYLGSVRFQIMQDMESFQWVGDFT